MSREPQRREPTVDTAAVLGKHAVLAVAVWAISAYTHSPAILYVALYLLITGIAAGALLPNVATEIRHETRCWIAVLCAGTLAVRLTLTLFAGAGERGVSDAFGAEFSATAQSLLGGHLPSLFVYAIISVPFAWTLWLTQRWRLHGRTQRYDHIVRHARRQDRFQP
ncbi:hypothetical protein M8C13_32500 [Crossiella sp. SN42]|uniref:hypothetical protein n=1 Tax=Crossiella sp. SN42 TaxID=2944808 RepID=UPI00207CA009|nr:hypothetical protein [Crossiella sp. SN42]MCO1580485.1 hypothetical protein [Crossiella sp. SN42]